MRVCKTLIDGSPSPLAAGQSGQVPPSPLSNCRQQLRALPRTFILIRILSDKTDPRRFTDTARGGSTGGSPRGQPPAPREPPARLWRSGDAARGGPQRGACGRAAPGVPPASGPWGGEEGQDAPEHQRDNKNLTLEELLSAVRREPLRLWMINARREQWTARAACRTQAR